MEKFDYSDVPRITLTDAENPVAAINYAPDYREMVEIVRGLMQMGEKSERALVLTQDLIDLNASNYTFWSYRRQCLEALKSKWEEETDYLDAFGEDNPKTYQLWLHRRTVAMNTGNGKRELDFTKVVFEEDAKNYHSWAHRQWALKTFGIPHDELSYIEDLLIEDVRNNSAWNHRWFVVHNDKKGVNDERVLAEVEFTLHKISLIKLNEAAWNYLRGYSETYPVALPYVLEKLQALAATEDYAENVPLFGLLADLIEKSGKLSDAASLFSRLSEMDRIREKFWLRRQSMALYSTIRSNL